MQWCTRVDNTGDPNYSGVICYGGMHSLNVDDMWELFESLLGINSYVRVIVSLLCVPFPNSI